MNPCVLVGPPGNGKSRLVRRFSELLHVGLTRFDASSSSDSVGFGGTPKGWGSSVPSLPTRGILQHGSPNFFVLVDEIEKGGTSHHNGNFLSTLTPYLERETSARMRDPSLDVTMDLSWVSYLATANSDVALPAQIKDRFRVIKMPAASIEHLPALARNVLAEKARDDGMDPAWAETLEPDELNLIGAVWQKHRFSIRALQKIVTALIDTREMLAPRH
jgi:ATP-dependent Lon protease